MADALYAKCHDEALKIQSVTDLLGVLLEQGYAPAHSFAALRIPNPIPPEGKERDLAIGSATAFMRFAPEASWTVIWPAFQSDRDFGKAVVSSLTRRIDLQGTLVTARLEEEQLAELYLWLVETYPEVESEEGVSRAGPRGNGSSWQNGILLVLQSRGTERACEAILRLIRELPEKTYLKWSLMSAREATRIRSWKPVLPEHILKMVRDPTKRLVRSGEDLLLVIIESLKNLAKKLRGETPLVSNLWNELCGGLWEPKDEDHFSDNVKQHLEDDLRVKGVVLNREVQIRRNRGNTKGERTDIHVAAVIPGVSHAQSEVITAIIEVKGCWNKGLWTAMKSQLADRYLAESGTRHGLYLVGWFNCPQWNPQDSRKQPKRSLRQAQERLEKQANELSEGRLTIKAVVLDTSLR